jgi:thiosulfate reductase cytochrome b subunit
MAEPDAAIVEPPPPPKPRRGELVRRHRLSTRLWHWINAVTLVIMLMSGLMIFNAHPRLYWGHYGANADHAWLVIDTGGGRAFPGWVTIPSFYSLADARLWHLAFAWVLAFGLLFYLVWSLLNRHIARDLHITRAEWRPPNLWHDVKQHARLRFPTGSAARRYNVLQKFSYCAVLFGLLPLVIFTGLAMGPGMNAAWPWLVDALGGRQSARSLHFLCAAGLVAFALVHVLMVLLANPLNEMRAMITGWYRLPEERR